jgi:hypothetical protein
MSGGHDIEAIDTRLTEVEKILPLLLHRITMLEQDRVDDRRLAMEVQTRLAAIEKDIAWMRQNFVTRDELERAINKLTSKMYGFGIVLCTSLVSAVYFIARNVH